jgi:cystathionine beta-lyase/cystathionine gamma-synthase
VEEIYQNRTFLFNLVGNMQQRPWRQLLRSSVMNSSLPASSLAAVSSSTAAAAAAALQLTEHMVALKGQQQHFAIVCADFARCQFLLQRALPRAAVDCPFLQLRDQQCGRRFASRQVSAAFAAQVSSGGGFVERLLELAGIGGGDQGRGVAGAAMRACVCL